MDSTIKQFQLNPDEEYDKFCGKVFLTTKRKIVLHCILCEQKYDYETYLRHINIEHLEDSKLDLDLEETTDNDKEEIFPLEENEFPISTLQRKNNISILLLKKDNLANENNIQIQPKLEEIEVTINTEPEIDEEVQIDTKKENRSRRTPIISSASGIYECEHCPQRFHLEFTLREHLKEHDLDRIYKCFVCGVQFKKEYALRNHAMRHEVEKQYKCNECDRSFVMPSELKYHQRKHNGEKPYQCESCGIKYAYKSTLRIHRKRHHTHQRDYPCPLCSSSYYTSRHLRDHMSKHTNEVIYKCEKCDKTFKQSSTFQRHKAQHRMQEEAEKNISPNDEQPDSTV